MNRSWVRWGILSLLAVALTFGQYEAPFKPYDPMSAVRPPSVRAQQPAPTEAPDPLDPVATLTPTPPAERAVEPSGEPTATLSPLSETSTPLPSDVATERPTGTPTQSAAATDTAAPTSTAESPVESTPSATDDLPALTDSVSPPGTSVEARIGREGGTISSPDGRVSVVFPAEAVAEDLSVRITRVEKSKLPPLPSQPLLVAWEFEAFSVDRDMAKVTQFPADLEIVTHFSVKDTTGRNPDTLKLWYLNEKGEWVEVSSSSDVEKGVQRARVNHFSTYGEGADMAVQMAPFLTSSGTNLSTGTATSSIPIDLPSAPGGLVPPLSLNYDSGRVDSMRNNDTSIGSWVGIGWDTAIGSIRYEPPSEIDSEEHYYLEMPGGGGGEILLVDNVWHLKDESFLRISETIVDGLDQWTVEDKSGKIYVFGGTDNTSRYYWYDVDEDEWDEQWVKRYYQWDIDYIEDVHENRITYEWEQVMAPAPFQLEGENYVRSSYVSRIIYGDPSVGHGHVRVEFGLIYDESRPYPDCFQTGEELEIRKDTYYDGACWMAGVKPIVTETRRLDSISIYVVAEAWQSNEQNGDLARKYQFSYETLSQGDKTYEDHPTDYRTAGTHLLTSVALLDREGSQTLYTSQYSYATYRFGWRTGEQCSLGTYFERPYLVTINNGFGGIARFSYGETPNPAQNCGDGLWSRTSVVQTNLHSGGGQPDMVTNIEYKDDSGNPSGPVYKDDAELLGYSQVTEREGKSVTLRPNGPGLYTQWEVQQPADSTPHWDLVNDDTPDGDTTYVRSLVAGKKDSYGLTDPVTIGAGTISGITLRWQWRRFLYDTSYSALVDPFVRVGTQDCYLGNRQNDKMSYKESAVFLPKNPCTGNAWTVNELTNLQVGFSVTGATNNADPVITQVAVDVAYYDLDTASYTKHLFHLDGAYHLNTQLVGREYETRTYGADGVQWSRNVSTWKSILPDPIDVGTPLSYVNSGQETIGLPPDPAPPLLVGDVIKMDHEEMLVLGITETSYPAQYTITVVRGYNGTTVAGHAYYRHIWIVDGSERPSFVYVERTKQYPNKDASEYDYIYTYYEYDKNIGELVKVREFGNGDAPYQMKVTETAYHYVTSPHYIVAPKSTAVCPPSIYLTCRPEDTLSRTYYYYDDHTDVDAAPTHGELTAVATQVTGGGTPTYTTTYTAYDSYGNVTGQSSPKAGLPSGSGIPTDVAKTVTEYDDTYHTYPIEVSVESPNDDPATQTTYLDYDYVLGLLTTRTEPTGREVEIRYDTFGRPTKVWDNFDTESYPTKQFEYHWDAAQSFKWTITWQRGAAGSSYRLKDTACYDGFGRNVQNRHMYNSSVESVQAVKFDSRGLKEMAATYYAANGCANFDESKPKTTYTYDPLGRAVTVTNPDSTSGSVDTSSLTAVAIDENGHKKASLMNGFGRVMRVEEYTGTGTQNDPYDLYATTTYDYDRLGNITSVTDEEDNESTMDYDMLGQKTAMDDMDMGAWGYEYNAAGNLTEQTDARGIVTTLSYDALGRLESKTYSNNDPAVNFYYDSYDDTEWCTQYASTAAGKLTKMTDGSGTTRWCYDLRGRAVKQRKTIDSVNYDVASTYDSANRPVDLTYPDGEVVRQTYHDSTSFGMHGQPKAAQSVTYSNQYYFMAILYTADYLAIDNLRLYTSPTTAVNFDYDNRGRLNNIDYGTIQHLDYTYDGTGDVKTITDNTVSPAEVTTFTYDELNRLTGASGGYSAAYEYSTNGRLLSKTEQYTHDYEYNDADHPHATTDAYSNDGPNYYGMEYDDNGNMTMADEIYAYNAENRLVQRWDGVYTQTYVYDGQGNLAKRTDSTDGSSVVYIGGIYEKKNDGTYVTYYNGLGRRIAMRVHPSGGGAGTLHFLLADHLGSTSTVVSAAGAVEQSQKYYPFGSVRSGNVTLTDKQFTGQQKEVGYWSDVFGLYNYGARFYSTTLGRFVSADPIVSKPVNPQSLDRYSYVHNNPLRYIDPTGYSDVDICQETGANCPGGNLSSLVTIVNDLMGDGLSRDQAIATMTTMFLVYFWTEYYFDTVAVLKGGKKPLGETDVNESHYQIWMQKMNEKCPGCFTDIRWISDPEHAYSGGIIAVPEPAVSDLERARGKGSNPDWYRWSMATSGAMRDCIAAGLTPYEVAMMPWNLEQRLPLDGPGWEIDGEAFGPRGKMGKAFVGNKAAIDYKYNYFYRYYTTPDISSIFG